MIVKAPTEVMAKAATATATAAATATATVAAAAAEGLRPTKTEQVQPGMRSGKARKGHTSKCTTRRPARTTTCARATRRYDGRGLRATRARRAIGTLGAMLMRTFSKMTSIDLTR